MGQATDRANARRERRREALRLSETALVVVEAETPDGTRVVFGADPAVPSVRTHAGSALAFGLWVGTARLWFGGLEHTTHPAAWS